MPTSNAVAIDSPSVTVNMRGTTYPMVRLRMQKRDVIPANEAKLSRSSSRLLRTAPMITTARMIAEPIRTGLSIRTANAGRQRRTSIPMNTGMSTMAKTSRVFWNCRPTRSPSAAK